MENEEFFEADAEVRFESERDIRHEESPLLSGDGPREASEVGASDIRGPSKWDGERDFDGRPWWNKPSVRSPILGMNSNTLTYIFRYSGFSLLISSSPWPSAAH